MVYLKLAARKDGLGGMCWMAAAMLLTIAAGGIQALGNVYITVVWSFDQNGVFHIVQAVGIIALVVGLRESLSCSKREEGFNSPLNF